MKYKIGDKIVYTHSQGSFDGEIIAVSSASQHYTVDFGSMVVPSVMDIVENDTGLRLALSAAQLRGYGAPDTTDEVYDLDPVDTDKNCPTCKNEWNVVKFNLQVWYDCITCNKTKEKILEERVV